MKNTEDTLQRRQRFSHRACGKQILCGLGRSFFTDLQFVSDLFIEQSPRHFLSDHLSPGRKRVKNYADTHQLTDSAGGARRPSPLFQWPLKAIGADRFRQKVCCTVFEGLYSHINVSVTGNKDNGQAVFWSIITR